MDKVLLQVYKIKNLTLFFFFFFLRRRIKDTTWSWWVATCYKVLPYEVEKGIGATAITTIRYPRSLMSTKNNFTIAPTMGRKADIKRC